MSSVHCWPEPCGPAVVETGANVCLVECTIHFEILLHKKLRNLVFSSHLSFAQNIICVGMMFPHICFLVSSIFPPKSAR